MPHLGDSIVLRGRSVRNRIAVPPMVCFGWTGNDGMATPRSTGHYRDLARGGAGMVIVEAACVHPDGRLSRDQLGLWDDAHVPGLAEIASAIFEGGAVPMIQVHHAGRTPFAKMSVKDIARIREDFLKATERAQAAGFQGIELHGAHGYLLDQIASPAHNLRTDDYGRDRMRFASELIAALKERFPGLILGYRMGVNNPVLEHGIAVARALEKAGVHLLHVSSSNRHPPLIPPADFSYHWIVYGGAQVREAVSIPTIAVYGIATPEAARGVVEGGLADIAAVGRAHLADPDFARKALSGEPIRACRRCARCQWHQGSDRCPARRDA